MVERMMLAMEGEHTLPPILRLAFRRAPRAQAGWEAMTPVQRRGHLLGVLLASLRQEELEQRHRKDQDDCHGEHDREVPERFLLFQVGAGVFDLNSVANAAIAHVLLIALSQTWKG